MATRTNKILTRQALNRKASLVFAAQDADAAADLLLADKYSVELAQLKSAAELGEFDTAVDVADYENQGSELADLLERYGFIVADQPPTSLLVSWGPEPTVNDTPATSPQITTVTPTTGPLAGGTLIRVQGSALTGIVQIAFTGTATVNPEWQQISGNEITFLSPMASSVGITTAGPAEFTVINTVGVSIGQTFTYTA